MAAKKKPEKRAARDPWPEYPLPPMSAGGVEGMREIYRRRTGEEITYEQAEDVLTRVVRFQYLNYVVNTEAELREREESGGTSDDGLEPEDEQIPGEPGAAEEDAGGEVLAGRARGAAAARVLLEPG